MKNFVGDTKDKIDAVKKLILMIQSGEKVSQTQIMFVIRFCLPTSDHYLKKLLLIFWEVVPKVSFQNSCWISNRVCLDFRGWKTASWNDFGLRCVSKRSPTSERVYSRIDSSVHFFHKSKHVFLFRFLCKLKEPELLEPLVPSIRKCLEHRHPYVRRNAILAIFTIYR